MINIVEYQSNETVHNPVAIDDKEGRLEIRQNIDNFEDYIKGILGGSTEEGDKINEDGLKEHFIGGSYIRELFIPKDRFIVSKIWKKERFWIIAQGEVTFATETGTKRVKAPYTEIPPMGSKVALYTHEDTLWFAITGADAKNSKEVEEEVIAKDYNECVFPYDERGKLR